MTDWTTDELHRIGDATELRISSRRDDGTLRSPVIIWHVALGDAVYVRSAHGPANGWFSRASRSGTGRVSSGGVEKDVAFTPASPDLRAEIDRAYHDKYDRYGPGPVGAVTGPDVLETTLRVTPTA